MAKEKSLIVQGVTLVEKLDQDLRKAATLMSRQEIRFLVDNYYAIQRTRIRMGNQITASKKLGEPSDLSLWVFRQFEVLETQAKNALQAFAKSDEMGIYLLGITGIGPVLSAGLICHIDIEQAPTVGHIWSFAGLDPTVRWIGTKEAEQIVKSVLNGDKKPNQKHVNEVAVAHKRNPANLLAMCTNDKGKITQQSFVAGLSKRPWNATLKTLCFKVGESFVKMQGRDTDVYGKLFAERKAQEWGKNLTGQLSEQALRGVDSFGKSTEAYKWRAGFVSADEATKVMRKEKDYADCLKDPTGIPMLPPAAIHARARRWVVKIFLSHVHEVWFRKHFKKDPPNPYPLAHLGHTHKIEPPEVNI